jgi:predicted RNA methylase
MDKPSAFHRLHNLRMENDEAKYRMEAISPRFKSIANRHENGTAPKAISANQLFQTPPETAKALVNLLCLKGRETILEPSAGLGRIIDALLPHNPKQITAIEIDRGCAGELYRKEYPQCILQVADFLSVPPPPPEQQFDAVAMNPPFQRNSDINHILHALRFLKPGGNLSAICLDTEHRRTALQRLAATWEPLPRGTFRKEGTDVPTILLSIKKPH